MRIVVTALMAGTIGVFFLLTQGGWILAGTGKSAELENTTPNEGRKVFFRYYHFDSVEGMTVENVDGKKIGKINNLIVDSSSGRPKYVIVKSRGAFLSRRRLILVPTAAIAISTAKVRVAAIDITERRWKNAPEFTEKELTSLREPEKARQIALFYDQAEWPVRTSQGPNGLTAHTSSAPLPNQSSPYQLARDLIGKQVVTRRGAEIGQVDDLIVDFCGEKPTLAIITIEGFSKSGTRFAAPLRLLNPTMNEALTINVEASEFQHAKEFQPDNSTIVANSDSREIFRYQR